jgi:uncharacterized membrane protein YccC
MGHLTTNMHLSRQATIILIALIVLTVASIVMANTINAEWGYLAVTLIPLTLLIYAID